MRHTDANYNVDHMIDQIESYTKETEIPIVAELRYQNKWLKAHFYRMIDSNEDIKFAHDMLISKKETALERGGLNKTLDKTMAVFSLKQIGWKDHQEIDSNINYSDNFIEILKQTIPLSKEDIDEFVETEIDEIEDAEDVDLDDL